MDYRDAFLQLRLFSNRCVYIASSSLSIHWNPNFITDITRSLLEHFSAGTIVMPAFCSDFIRTGKFFVSNSKSICGQVAEYYRQLPFVSRTVWSPLHTVCCSGKLANHILNLHPVSSFGKSTVFELLREVDADLILIDCPFFDGVPFINSLEEEYSVSYRFWKTISGEIIYGSGDKENATINWFAKCIGQFPEGHSPFREKARRVRLTELGKLFYETQHVKQTICGRTKFVTFRVGDFYRFFEPILKKNINGFIQG